MSHDKIDDAMAINYESDLAHWKKRAIDAESALAAPQSQQEPTEPVAWFPLLGTGLAIRRNLLNEEFAQRNHSQTLTRLAERGGLSIDEAVANISRTQWKSRETKDALAELAKLTAPLSGVRDGGNDD